MIRCLVVDDSPTFRAVMRAILASGAGLEVVGEAADGYEAVAKVRTLRPDVVTMDVRMPGKDGLAAIEEIMEVAPTPIVVVSAEGPENQEIAFWALELGAIEVLGKPRSAGAGRFERDAEAIRTAIRAVVGVKVVTRHRRRRGKVRPPDQHPAPPARRPAAAAPSSLPAAPPGAAPRVLGIAASTGGPAALARILRGLPAGYPLPVLVVQHLAPGFDVGLVHWLAAETPLAVTLAREGEAIEPGTVYFAPEGRHLAVAGGVARLSDGPPLHGFRPSGTFLLSALAREYGGAAAGLVLTGMGDDGADGLKAIRERGGWTAAQGPQSSVVFGMPRAALERGAAGQSIELEDIAAALVALARPERRAGA